MAIDERIPAHLPRKLTISLWDFSWYTMTMPGEPFDDLDRAFAKAVERGYNTVRICAMPFFLFTPDGPRPGPIGFSNLGGEFGQRTRWYNTRGGATLEGHAHLLRLFRAARAHDCYVILSSWEYQQSPSFLREPDLLRELLAVPPERRCLAQSQSMGQLVQFLKEHGLTDRIAYVELHNEVDCCPKLAEAVPAGRDTIAGLKPFLEEGVALLRARHPDVLVTACYAFPTTYRLRDLAANLQVAHFHLYVYGMLRELYRALGLNGDGPPDDDVIHTILRPDAPPYADWTPLEDWRLNGTDVSRWSFYVYDWADPDTWDLWLYERYAGYREAMRQTIDRTLAAMADWAAEHHIPAVIGEGYVGYTPLRAGFEEGPVGKDVAGYAVEACLRHDFWGIILCSNAAPHHPFWHDVAWQQGWNRRILEEA